MEVCADPSKDDPDDEVNQNAVKNFNIKDPLTCPLGCTKEFSKQFRLSEGK